MTTTPIIRRADEGRTAVLELDHPDRSMNVVDERLLAELRERVAAALADDGIDALVLASAKPGLFGAGADIDWLPELAARDDAERFLAEAHELMVALVRSAKPMVAALNGPAFGGALELALGAREILAVPTSRMGLPEVTLGLLPGGGGTQLLSRFVGVEVAAELLTSGRRLTAEEACEAGLIAEVVDEERLRERALVRAAELVGSVPDTAESNGDDALAVLRERQEVLTSSRAGLSPAAASILEVLRAGVADGLEAGLAAERTAFLARLRSPEARAAIHLFQAEAEVKRRSRTDARPMSRLGVIGGGQMGAGIAATAVARGGEAVVRDIDEESLERARDYLDKVLLRFAPPAGDDEVAARWHGTTAWDGFDQSDAVIEAVFELPELKHEVLTELGAAVSETTLVASNTSAISIRDLAASLPHPERFLGMHFFSPVERMPLVELIPHTTTAAQTTARAAAVGRQLGKIPIVVGDAPGFFTSRVYARWLMEGIRLLLDGLTPEQVDAAATSVGFPVGPLRAHDEATLDLVVQASITQVADVVMADRLDVAAVRSALETLLEAGIRGRRHGLGFYRYDEQGKRIGPNDEVLGVLGTSARPMSPEVAGERLLLAFVTECLLCWDDGTLCHPDDGDVAAVLGIGFPRVLGGPFHWVDEEGAAQVLARCRALGTQAFPGGATLERLAVGGERFTDEPRRPAPFADADGTLTTT